MAVRAFTVVGGASAYAPGLVAALIHHHRRLSLQSVRLYDIDSDRLETVGRLCARMARAADAAFEVEAHARLDDALEGCDAVLNSARPGGFECRRIDETLPLELGVPGQETVGPGGFFFALRSVPQAVELARRMEALCPHAVLLNYTNPTNIVSQALCQRSQLRVIGLCDQSDEDLRVLATGLGKTEVTAFSCFGLNHATWYGNLQVSGEPLPAPLPTLATPPGLNAEHALRFALSCELAASEPGFWPNSYLPYYTHPGQFVALARERGPRTDAITAELPSYYRHFAEQADRDEPELKHHRGADGFGDLAVRVLHALATDTACTLVLNTPNVEGHPAAGAESVVEHRVQLSCDAQSVRDVPPMPASFGPLLRQLETYQLQTAQAAADADAGAALEALRANPLVSSHSLATRLLERARRAYGDRIPMLT